MIYTVHMQARFTSTSSEPAGLSARLGGGAVLGAVRVHGSGRVGTTFEFPATSATLEFHAEDLAAGTTLLFGNGGRSETFVQILEQPDVVETTGFE